MRKHVGRNFLEEHKHLQSLLGLDVSHVIVDRDDWQAVVRFFNQMPSLTTQLFVQEEPDLEATMEILDVVEVVGKLMQPIQPEGFTEAKTGRVFSGVVVEKGNAGTDHAGELLLGSGCTIPNFVPVLLNWKHPVGNATIEHKEDCLVATVNILDMELLEKLKGKQPKLYPCAGGQILEREGNVITKFKLTSVGLSDTPNADATIPPINFE